VVGLRAECYGPCVDAALHGLLTDAIERAVCSAAAISVGDTGVEVVRLAVGHTRSVPDRGAPISTNAFFDLASLTKPIATTAVAMALCSEHRLDLEASAAHWLDGAIDPRVRVEHLIGHAAGLPPHARLYERIWAGDLDGCATAREALIRMALAQPLEAAPGERASYSDLGYIALGALLERAGGAPLEELFDHLVAGPWRLHGARFVDVSRPPGERPSFPGPVVATEIDERRGLVVGEVHDENCHAGGGVAGHAGLFATIGDVGRFAAAMVELAAGHDREPLGAGVALRFLATSAAPHTSWRLGWDTPSPEPGVSHAGDLWPRQHSVGHLGFTGTSLWLDLARRRWVALLTNRVHPTREGARAAAIRELRRTVNDTVIRYLGL